MGKSFLVREFGRDSFSNVVELNFEMRQELAAIFSGNLDPIRLVRDLKIATQQEIIPGQTLLFFDEIWILDSKSLMINRGPIVESYVGQELLTATPAHIRAELFYWVREKATSLAEVDYIWTKEEKIIPIEVKSGSGRRGKSVQLMLIEKPHIKAFCQISVDRFHTLRNGTNIPLYGIHFCKAL